MKVFAEKAIRERSPIPKVLAQAAQSNRPPSAAAGVPTWVSVGHALH